MLKANITISLVIIVILGLVGFILWVNNQPPAEKAGSKFHYVQDCRTNLCFAYSKAGYHMALAEVPCEKVEHVLNNKCSALEQP